MDFKYIKDESEYKNSRYLVRAYGKVCGSYITEKRRLTKEKLIKIFKENTLYKKYFNEEVDTFINGRKVKAPVRICGYKKREYNLD